MRIFPGIAALALVLCVPLAAQAGDPPRRTFDKKIEKAAAQKAAEKLGELRGMIFEDVSVDYLATGKVGGAMLSPKTLSPGVSGKTKRKLPPVVRNERETIAIDPVQTRSIRTEDGRARVSMIFGVARQ